MSRPESDLVPRLATPRMRRAAAFPGGPCAIAARAAATLVAAARATATLGVTAAFAAILASAPSAHAQQAVERRAQLDADGYFRIWNPAGSVRVSTWDRDTVWLRGTLDAGARRGFYFGSAGPAGKMGVQTGAPEARADFEVVLPRNATVWIKTTTGSIEVEGVGGGVDAYSVTGEVRVNGDPRTLFVESMAGAVRVVGVPGTLRAKTGGGAIVFRGSSPDVTLATVSGELVLEGGAVRRGILESVSGAVRFSGGLERGGSLSIQTHDGAVDLALPRDVDADFVVTTLDGKLTQRLVRESPGSVSGPRGREQQFTAGAGGAEVRVRTFSGAIVVRPIEGVAGGG